MASTLENEEKKTGKFQWVLMVFIIPLLTIVAVAIVLLQISGVNVFKEAVKLGENVPVLQSFYPADDATLSELENRSLNLQAEIEDREAEIASLETKLLDKDNEIKQVELQKEQLEAQIEELRQVQSDDKRVYTEVISTYESMSPKKAAPIIVELKDDEALKILSQVSPEHLGKILEAMTPTEAAKYTALLATEGG